MKKIENLIINTRAIIMLSPWLIKNSPVIIGGYFGKNGERKRKDLRRFIVHHNTRPPTEPPVSRK